MFTFILSAILTYLLFKFLYNFFYGNADESEIKSFLTPSEEIEGFAD